MICDGLGYVRCFEYRTVQRESSAFPGKSLGLNSKT